ncbi:hypothetical protein F4X86_00975 [Candidatus Saccharibacteria bacterium]|nr:hypothetical protein [Candidatus Saccharibacteria bacterium]
MRVNKGKAGRPAAGQKLPCLAGIYLHAGTALFGIGSTGIGLRALAGNTSIASNALSLALLGLGFLLILGSSRAVRNRWLQLRAIRGYSPV